MHPGEETGFLGRRPWPVLAFFAVLGLTNLAKGLFFGTLFVLLPAVSYLLANADWKALRRYIWLPGWLTFLAVGSAWPIAACLRYPDVIAFWEHDYLGRVNQGYMREPFWYYFANLPLLIFPWSIPALYGLWLTGRAALRQRLAPERFLWCWALVPVLFFSIPQGKHHHYLLQCLAPWAVLGALGAVRLWKVIRHWTWLESPWPVVIFLGLLGDVALVAAGSKLPGPGWLVPVLLAGWPMCVYLFWWAGTQKNGWLAIAGVCALLVPLHWLVYAYRTACWDRYRDDSAFVHQVKDRVPAGKAILVLDDDAPLNASWLLFYLGDRAMLLHNVTFLLDEKIVDKEIYLIARGRLETSLSSFGAYEALLESKKSRYELTAADRYRLYRVRLHERLGRQGRARISPLQATGRAPGPFLTQ